MHLTMSIAHPYSSLRISNTWRLSCTTWDQKKIYFACEGYIGFWILDENFTLHGLADHHIDHFRWTNPSSALSIMNYELQTCPWHEIKAQFQKLWIDFKYLKTKMNACMDPTTKWKIYPSALMWSSFLAFLFGWRREDVTPLQVNDYNRAGEEAYSPFYWSDLK